MNKKLVFTVLGLTIITLCGCHKENKKVILSDDIAKEVKIELSDTKELMLRAKNKLQESDYAGAKVIFEKIIQSDKGNKENYIEIKNYYLEYERYDDAYSVIRTAIENNVDVENMTSILEEIKSSFEKVEIIDSIYQDEEYILPKEIQVTINDELINIPVKWNVDKVNTNEPGNLVFNGVNEQYGRQAVVELDIKENVYTEEVGYVENIYEADNKKYIEVDLVEFYLGEDSNHEAYKDGITDRLVNFYIRDNSDYMTIYTIENDTKYLFEEYNFEGADNNTDLKEADYNFFVKWLGEYTQKKSRHNLFRIKAKNGVIYEISHEFTQ